MKKRLLTGAVMTAVGIGLCFARNKSGSEAAEKNVYTEASQTQHISEEAREETASAENIWENAPILSAAFPDVDSLELGQIPEGSLLIQNLFSILPKSWYAGDYGKKPVVKSQGKYGTCWALTATSGLEAALLPEENMVFSADHMSRKNAFTVDIEAGGDYLMTMAYLSGWQGPVLETQDPYGDEYSPDGLEAAVHVQEMQILEEESIEAIKQAVYTYGAVQTSLYMSRETTASECTYYNEETHAYYYPEQTVQNHDILILGWDDSYSRFHFRQIPSADGAFICQNTWGRDFGEDGIFYVSYADANIGKAGIVYSRIDAADNYDRIYQADDCGWQGNQGYDTGTCWFANIYTASEAEELAAVGFYATSSDTEYEIYLVHDFAGTDSFEKRELLQTGSMMRTGYYTVDLLEERQLSPGERFAVVVKITVPEAKNPVAVEYPADAYTQNVTLEGRESYLSQYGEYWENTQERFGTNVCLKAYTRNAAEEKNGE